MLLFLQLGSLLVVEFGTQWHLKCTKWAVIAAMICSQLFRPGIMIVVSRDCFAILAYTTDKLLSEHQ